MNSNFQSFGTVSVSALKHCAITDMPHEPCGMRLHRQFLTVRWHLYKLISEPRRRVNVTPSLILVQNDQLLTYPPLVWGQLALNLALAFASVQSELVVYIPVGRPQELHTLVTPTLPVLYKQEVRPALELHIVKWA